MSHKIDWCFIYETWFEIIDKSWKNGWHSLDNIYKCISQNKDVKISKKMKFVYNGAVDNKLSFV